MKPARLYTAVSIRRDLYGTICDMAIEDDTSKLSIIRRAVKLYFYCRLQHPEIIRDANRWHNEQEKSIKSSSE